MSDSFEPLPQPFPPSLVPDLLALQRGEWWSVDRTQAQVERILAGSQVCVGAVDREGRLASFARVVTDYVTFAVILDVVVRDDLRGHGLGARLMNDIVSHPDLQQLRGIGLQCEERLVEFYERWGFTDAAGRSRQMKRVVDLAAGERLADASVVTR